MYYLTKDEASTYQMVISAVAMREALTSWAIINPTDEAEKALEKGLSKFTLRVFNRMSHDHDREASGVQVVSSLLQLPAYFTPPELYSIRSRR